MLVVLLLSFSLARLSLANPLKAIWSEKPSQAALCTSASRRGLRDLLLASIRWLKPASAFNPIHDDGDEIPLRCSECFIIPCLKRADPWQRSAEEDRLPSLFLVPATSRHVSGGPVHASPSHWFCRRRRERGARVCEGAQCYIFFIANQTEPLP